MKTTWKLKFCFKLFLLTASFFGCKDNEDPDPRQAFIGAYEMDDFDINVRTGTMTVDTTFLLSNSSEIEFELEDDLDPDELKLELEEFLEDVILGSLNVFTSSSLSISADLDDITIAEISSNKFELDDHEFDIILSDGSTTEIHPCEIQGEGELDGNELTFDFEITIFAGGSNITFEGTIVGERN